MKPITATDRLIAYVLGDFKGWLFSEEVAVAIAHRVERTAAARIVATACLDVATMRMRGLGVTLESVLSLVRTAYGEKKK